MKRESLKKSNSVGLVNRHYDAATGQYADARHMVPGFMHPGGIYGIHRDWRGLEYPQGRKWTITHVPSGAALASGLSFTIAREAVFNIARKWVLPEADFHLKAGREMKDAFKRDVLYFTGRDDWPER
jgi:hypothetical protein